MRITLYPHVNQWSSLFVPSPDYLNSLQTNTTFAQSERWCPFTWKQLPCRSRIIDLQYMLDMWEEPCTMTLWALLKGLDGTILPMIPGIEGKVKIFYRVYLPYSFYCIICICSLNGKSSSCTEIEKIRRKLANADIIQRVLHKNLDDQKFEYSPQQSSVIGPQWGFTSAKNPTYHKASSHPSDS